MILNVSIYFSWFLHQVHCDATIAFPILVAETFAKKSVAYNGVKID